MPVDRAAVAVDWPGAARCAAFWDAVGMLPPGIPHLRAFQRAQAEVGVAWLRHRVGEGATARSARAVEIDLPQGDVGPGGSISPVVSAACGVISGLASGVPADWRDDGQR
ncbi:MULTISPECIES: hypothetical protein [unclassified Cellulosimicrobium]|uniref:hypothetical protein n=1 Tax=Cellulosimicrobium sp. TH-20 TaxID=1980001 RepID=UPI0015831922